MKIRYTNNEKITFTFDFTVLILDDFSQAITLDSLKIKSEKILAEDTVLAELKCQ